MLRAMIFLNDGEEGTENEGVGNPLALVSAVFSLIFSIA